MGGSWKTENHIKLLYCLHFITLLIITLCFLYSNIISAKICQYQDTAISRPAPTSGLLKDPSDPSDEEIIFQQRTKRNPILAQVDQHEYQTSLKDLLEQEKKKVTDKPKRKRLKLRIMFNESHPDNPFNSGVGDPTIVSLPSENEVKSENDPWIMIPIYSKIQMNYLKDFCFSLHDFCADGKNDQQMEIDISETSAAIGSATIPKVAEKSTTNVEETTTQPSPSTENVTEQIEDMILPYNKSLLEVVEIDALYDGTTKSLVDIVTSTTVAGKVTVPMVADKDAVNYYDENEAFGKLPPGGSRKRKKCFIHQIGKPIEIGYRLSFYGAWMRDARPRFEQDEDKRWVMEHFSGIHLFEYTHEDDLYKPELKPVKTITLPHMFEGTSHVMYHGSVYYQRASYPTIVRYDLYRNYTRQATIHGTSYRGSSHLYGENLENYFDLAVDENGLWVMYRYEGLSFLSVARLHPKTLKVLRNWNLTEIDTNAIGNCWVTCGVVYMVKSGKLQNTTLHFAYDLYKQQYARLDNVEWTNVYSNANMIAYNPKDRKIYIYDNGHLIIVPLLLNFDVD